MSTKGVSAVVCISWCSSPAADSGKLPPRSFTRVGCMILLLHDVCDVLMEAAKMCKYCGQEVRPPASYFPYSGRFRLLFSSTKGACRWLGSAAPTSTIPCLTGTIGLACALMSTHSVKPARSPNAPRCCLLPCS